ncbi:MAG: transcription antitermination protein NusB [Prevotellaceae bacterium]|jgi:N utilization substance protein B|nr:transcription antitermination protein NusB [Prevotellaceae bacterium]
MISRRLLRIKVLKEFYGYVIGDKSFLPAVEQELRLSINKTYEQYKYLFCFIPLLQEHAQNKAEIGMQKFLPTSDERNPNMRFIDNILIKQIAENKDLQSFSNKNSVIIADATSVVGKMYNNITGKDYFMEYMSHPETSFKQDKKLVIDILNNEFEDFNDLYSLLEEQSIFWTDEPEFVVSCIVKTVNNIKAGKPFALMPLYKNGYDEIFAERLIRHAIANYKKYNALIDEHTPNWDVERIALMDILILVIAISELLEFVEIPVKVTLDEYIDIARYYSSSSSCVFINGVLDKIVAHFEANNLFNKTGKVRTK